jgi:ribosome-associated toxin RatA of RatAB toxin-antitoxin module
LLLFACHAIGAEASPTDDSASHSLVGAHAVAERGRPDDIDVAVVLDPAEQAGQASATVRIRARREVVWSLITSCPAALTLVPGLVKCEVLETAADHSWQVIRHVVDYSWFVRKLDYRIRASYDRPNRVSIERISGDLKTLKAGWSLEADGDCTVARYSVDLAPGFWVPRWLVRSALKHDLPTMLRALRARAEGEARGS